MPKNKKNWFREHIGEILFLIVVIAAVYFTLNANGIL